MTNQKAKPNDEVGWRFGRHSEWPFRHSFVILFSGFVIAAILAAASGFGPWPPSPPKPLLYHVTGRVFDGATKQPLPNVRLRLRAVVPVDFDVSRLPTYGDKKPTGKGTIPLTAFGFTKADGTYDMELSEGFAVIRNATEIRIDASVAGYEIASADMPTPAKPQDVYKAPDLYLAPKTFGFSPGTPRTGPTDTKLIPWK